MGADLWYRYIAPCDGTLQVSLCEGTSYDAMLATYGGGLLCTCPPRFASPIECGDDTCGSQGGPPFVELGVTAGRCYAIQVGGWGGEVGTGTLALDYISPCNPTDLTGDDNTDLRDYARFQNCFGPVVLGCGAADFNRDGAVDLRDYRAMHAMWVPGGG